MFNIIFFGLVLWTLSCSAMNRALASTKQEAANQLNQTSKETRFSSMMEREDKTAELWREQKCNAKLWRVIPFCITAEWRSKKGCTGTAAALNVPDEYITASLLTTVLTLMSHVTFHQVQDGKWSQKESSCSLAKSNLAKVPSLCNILVCVFADKLSLKYTIHYKTLTEF